MFNFYYAYIYIQSILACDEHGSKLHITHVLYDILKIIFKQ